MSAGGHVRLEGIVKRHGAVTVLHGVDHLGTPGDFGFIDAALGFIDAIPA